MSNRNPFDRTACSTTLRYAPACPVVPPTIINNLTVTGLFSACQQIGSTLTLTGTGGPNPMYEAALCVKAGAQFDGLTQHAKLRVLQDSDFIGAVKAPIMVGPVGISKPNSGPTLTVDGETATDQLTALSGNIGLLNTDSIFTSGYAVGPLAASETLIAVAGRLCVVVNGTGTKQMIGFAVSPNKIVTPYSWTSAVLFADNVGFDAPDRIIQSGVLAPEIAYSCVGAGSGLSTCPAGNLSCIQMPTSTPVLAPGTAKIANYTDGADTPFPGMLCVVAYTNLTLGSVQIAEGVITSSSLQMYNEYTSLQITLTSGRASLPPGANGAIVLDYTGTLLGIVQTGNTDSATLGTTYSNTITAIKGRYINYFLNNLAAVTALPSLSSYGYTTTRGIATNKRVPANLPGGITTNANGSAIATEQILALTSAAYSNGFGLGTLGQNTPSFTDSLLHIKAQGGVTAKVYSSVPSGSVTVSGFNYVGAGGQVLWRNQQIPNSLSVPPGGNAAQTQFVASFSQGGVAITQNNVLLKNLAYVKPGEFIALQNGAANDSRPQYDAVLVAGDATAVSGFLSGLAYARAGWINDSNYQSTYPAGSILVVIGGINISNNFITQSNYYPTNYGVVSGLFGVQLTAPNQLAVTYSVGSLSLVSHFTGVYNTWYYNTTVDTSAGFPLELDITSSASTITYTSGTSSGSLTIGSVSTTPTTIY
jgi:hypothetical protein